MKESLYQGVTERDVMRVKTGESVNGAQISNLKSAERDFIAVEEPLEIRIRGETIAITMRTPGDDVRLALGFLFAEGIIESLADVETIVDDTSRTIFEGENIVDILPDVKNAAGMERVLAMRRGTLTTSACGVCGRKSIGDLTDRCVQLPLGPSISADFIVSSIKRLRDAQLNFSRTGGVHASAAFAAGGEMLAIYEDVGRHNAADKVVGALLQQRLIGPGRDAAQQEKFPVLLTVSGRASFELAQKTIVAGLPILASVSAPSSLAIDLALSSGLTLVGFTRGDKFNVYCHPERIDQFSA